MQSKKFQRRKEDFTCKKCGAVVFGTGYTNHCPQCLWGRHVDVNPGDRAATCRGLMEPVGVVKEGGRYSIIHRCIRCDIRRKNKISKQDNFDMVIELARRNMNL